MKMAKKLKFCKESKHRNRALLEVAIFSLVSGYLFYRSFFAVLIIFIVFLTRLCHKIKNIEENERQKQKSAFLDFLTVLKRLSASGMAIQNAIIQAKSELKLIYPDKNAWIINRLDRLARALALDPHPGPLLVQWGEEDQIKDIEDFGTLLQSMQTFGGDMSCMIQDTARMMSERIETENQIQSLSASKIFEQKVLFALGYVMVGVIGKAFPGLFGVLYTTFIGRAVMTICFGFMLLGRRVGLSMAKIKV